MYSPSEKDLQARTNEEANAAELISHISNARKDQIRQFNDPRVFEAEKKYGKYLYVPLALPIFELPEKEHFLSWWNSNFTVPNKLKADTIFKEYGMSPFEAIDIIHKIGDHWDVNLKTESFKKEFPKLYQQFFDQLPCDDILKLTLWSSIKPLPEHRDTGEVVDVPMSFRVKLYDENPDETLFLFDNPLRPYSCGEPVALPRAPGTNSFVWNNLRVKHGSIYNPEHKKILAVVFCAVNVEKYTSLMDASINIYEDYCIQSKNTIENYVNI